MRRRMFQVMTSVVVSATLLASCADDGAAVPSATELSDSLLMADDLEGEWSLATGPDDDEAAVDPSGVLTEEQRDMLPSFDICDRASEDAKKAAEDLRPVVFRQLELAVDDEIDPPFDRSGHMVFLQEFLYSGDSDEIEDTFTLLREGLTACLGAIPAGEEGPGTAVEMVVPEVGDDRFGVLTTIEEAGGWAEWRIHNVIMRGGPVMMSLVVVDIRADADPYFTADEFDDIVLIAAEKLS